MKTKTTKPIGASKATTLSRVTDTGFEIQNEKRVLEEGLVLLDRAIARGRGPHDPAIHVGSAIFTPESTSFLLDTAQSNLGTNAVNSILKSGQDYKVPIMCGGDGVFLATGIRATFWQRFFNNQEWPPGTRIGRAVWLQIAPMLNQFDTAANGAAGNMSWTTKFSCWKTQPEQGNHAASPPSVVVPMLNYAWNLQDERGWTYSDQLLPRTAMLDRTVQMPFAATNFNSQDGNIHRFSAPLEMQRKTVMQFVFRPLTDIVQFDSSINGTSTGLGFDDRENGLRNQSVKVQVEIIGQQVPA